VGTWKRGKRGVEVLDAGDIFKGFAK
jgi:hypothetical protein